jgi:hypothetical protein
MLNRMCIHLKNGGEEDRTVTVEDLCALHLPRYPLTEGVVGPREQRSIDVTRNASLPGMASPGSGCIRVFSPHRIPRTLTVCEGDFVALE